jgi:hypothetical protein
LVLWAKIANICDKHATLQIKICKFVPKVKGMHFTGLLLAISTFIIIGVFHPVVIKTEYYFGTRPWWLFLVAGLACVGASLCIADTILSAIVGVTGASLLWSIGELFEQKKRVERGWFPINPKRKAQYSNHKEQDADDMAHCSSLKEQDSCDKDASHTTEQ